MDFEALSVDERVPNPIIMITRDCKFTIEYVKPPLTCRYLKRPSVGCPGSTFRVLHSRVRERVGKCASVVTARRPPVHTPPGSSEALSASTVWPTSGSLFTQGPPLQGRVSLMPSHDLLKQLDRLDRSSSGFHDQVNNILYGEEYKQSVPNLRNNDLVWLVDYLDNVRRLIALSNSPLKLAQVLDILDTTSAGFRKGLHELREICSDRMTLPTSYTLSPSLLNIGRYPAASGGSGDVYEGTLDGSKVCIKHVELYSKDGPENATKVHHLFILPVYCC